MTEKHYDLLQQEEIRNDLNAMTAISELGCFGTLEITEGVEQRKKERFLEKVEGMKDEIAMKRLGEKMKQQDMRYGVSYGKSRRG